MDALALLQRAASAGFLVTARDGDLHVRGPRTRPELIQELCASKEAVLNALRDEVARATVPPAWIEIDGVPYSPAAADLYRRSVPFSADAASDRCRSCSGTRWWRLRDGCPWVCARCHPTDRAENEVEWRERTPAGEAGGITLPLAPTGGPKTIPAPSECPACGSPLSWLRAGESAWRCRDCDPPPDGESPALLGRLENAS